jgi:hypothetical protein
MGLIITVLIQDVYFTHPACASLGTPLFACGGKRGFKMFCQGRGGVDGKNVIARRNDEAIANHADSLCKVRDCHASLAMTQFFPALFPAKLKRGPTSAASSG